MLVRILADNPGKSFTKNIDQKFVGTVKELLRDGKDMSVQQILRETLDTFEEQKANDETLALLTEMWKKEKEKMGKRFGSAVRIGEPRRGPGYQNALQQPMQQNMMAPTTPNIRNQQNYFARNHRPRGLPPPLELAQRVEEARTSAKLLSQVVQSTPPNEVLGNELIKEFVERCQSATRSMQDYIHSDNPAPDEDTLLTLIETNDQLATAISKHQRALLQARRATGASPLSSPRGHTRRQPRRWLPQTNTATVSSRLQPALLLESRYDNRKIRIPLAISTRLMVPRMMFKRPLLPQASVCPHRICCQSNSSQAFLVRGTKPRQAMTIVRTRQRTMWPYPEGGQMTRRRSISRLGSRCSIAFEIGEDCPSVARK